MSPQRCCVNKALEVLDALREGECYEMGDVLMALLDEQREQLWKRVVDNWEDAATHGAFLEYCQRTGALSDAATRYRGMSGDRERGPEAQRRLQGVVVLAIQAMMAERTPPHRGLPAWLVALSALLCAVGVGYTLFRLYTMG
ncbi:MAG: hypothetical protein RMJ98_02865 [Myxococcales bacterium]|nr:hypothetical protein [Polyangiaceae bacterium]MDW8248232.1 hypothetical protein [Myxococcales bacterium]